MSTIFQPRRYQVHAGGYRSQTDDLAVAKSRADIYYASGWRGAEVTENNDAVVYRAAANRDELPGGWSREATLILK